MQQTQLDFDKEIMLSKRDNIIRHDIRHYRGGIGGIIVYNMSTVKPCM